ncbi:DUF4465 domain-containing protein [Dysgonomonas sp. 520]|uniref:DUF4465 domain-containing protein n=1 Tax=Dysgonomonas sp. 520 TaxID=2302931 RepID=UPI0013D026D2|nr:DUF4465 domain-containing protein [Dysgonomonas sp. 520]NDW08590.1 DUF4465 domain-containing protein [Dysgonomonas sp. 520]
MKKRFYSLFVCIALVISNISFAADPGDIITLDLSKTLNPTEFAIDPQKGQWTGTYDDENYPFIEFNSFAFSHIINGMGMGSYWDGFTYCTSGDITNYGAVGNSDGWIANQWGCMAGGGIKTDEEGNILKNGDGEVVVEKGIPYLVAYWGHFMETYGEHSLQTILTDGEMYEAVGVYVNNHPWPYFGILSGDGYATPFSKEGDNFKLIIHGLDENYEDNGLSVTHTLAEFKDGKLIQNDKWEWVDLSPLGRISGLYYTMETSDANPMWGPNTATYFCLDKLQVRVPITSGIKDNTPNVQLIIHTNYVEIESDQNTAIEIYDMQGRKVLSDTVLPGINTIDTTTLQKGIYIVKCGSEAQRFVK